MSMVAFAWCVYKEGNKLWT